MLIGQIWEIELDCMFYTSFGGCIIIKLCENIVLMIFEWNLHIIGAEKGKEVSGVK